MNQNDAKRAAASCSLIVGQLEKLEEIAVLSGDKELMDAVVATARSLLPLFHVIEKNDRWDNQ